MRTRNEAVRAPSLFVRSSISVVQRELADVGVDFAAYYLFVGKRFAAPHRKLSAARVPGMPDKPTKSSPRYEPLHSGRSIMRPSEHRLRAEQLRRAGRHELATHHELLARVIEKRLSRKPTLH